VGKGCTTNEVEGQGEKILDEADDWVAMDFVS
jgi:hypothetical protein